MKLFVGGLSWGTDDNALRAAFQQYGDVSDAKVIQDRDTGPQWQNVRIHQAALN